MALGDLFLPFPLFLPFLFLFSVLHIYHLCLYFTIHHPHREIHELQALWLRRSKSYSKF
ncbi:hypothetical protein BDQ12DRAFT_687113 [Crucibulum laeve]|uniref:Uncharacterized protein n=1 Tax=Crucibulum laeve TaxID=68775 RepID=A0A5C3LTZ7_9AGAR|nr:hypothetical protein BDQ12DRAFT_687113 [Crucibulum laeve]